MPIIVNSEIRVFSELEFHKLAEKVIGVVFDVHNDFGRLMEEDVIAEDTCLAMTALKSGTETMQDHLQHFLSHTKLACLQWVNFNHHEIELQTITRC